MNDKPEPIGDEQQIVGKGPEITERVERTDVGVSITAEIKRGEGTRDQDKLTVKVKQDSLESARADMDEAMGYARDWADELRMIQPGGDE